MLPSRRLSLAWVVTLAAGFLVVRAGLFAVTTAGEYALYRDYAQEARETSLAELYAHREVEYPPLAILFGVLALDVTAVLPEGVEGLTAWRPNPSRGVEESRYEVGLGLTLFAVDLACLVLVGVIARRCYPDEGPVWRVVRQGMYVAATAALGLIMYDRQDLVVGLFPLVALWTFAARRSLISYAVLTAGVAYKLVPLLLVPLWVGGFAAARTAPGSLRSFLAAVAGQAVRAGLILAAYPVLSYLLLGPESFRFLGFHSERGLQLEAAAAWLVFAADPAALVGYSHGSHSVLSPWADEFAWAGTALTGLATGALMAVTIWRLGRLATAVTLPDPNRLIAELARGSLGVWLAFILFNKVGSPQYLLWLAPLLPLLPLRGRDWGLAVVLLAAMVFTTLVFPGQYPLVRGELVRGHDDDSLAGQVWSGPTPVGVALLAAKSVSLAIAFVWLGVSVWGDRLVAPSSRRSPP